MLFKEFTTILNPHSRRIVFGIGLNAIGGGMTLSLLMVYLHDMRGFSNSFNGVLMAWGAAVALLSSAPIGTLVDRIGPRKVIVSGLVLSSAMAFGYSFVEYPWQAIICMTFFSIGGQCIWPAQIVILTRVTPEADRQKIFGFNFMLLNLGLGVGGLISSLIIQEGSLLSFQVMYWVDGSTFLLYLFIILGLKTKHADKYVADSGQPQDGTYRELFSIKPLLLLALASVILFTFGYGPIQAGIPIFATQFLGLSPKWLGIIFGVNTLAIVLLQPLVLRILEKFSAYTALISIGVIWSISWIVVGVTPLVSALLAGIALCVSQLIFAFGEMVSAPTGPAVSQSLTPEHLRGRSSAITSMQWAIPGMIGPAVAGFMMGAHLEVAWVVAMALGALLPVPLFIKLRAMVDSSNSRTL